MTLLDESGVSPPEAAPPSDPVAVAVRLRPPVRAGVAERFTPTDPPKGWDLAAHPRIARILRSRRFQFALIVPNQIVFWLVISLGLLGTVVPGLNFGTAITWYIWFCLVFVMMVVVVIIGMLVIVLVFMTVMIMLVAMAVPVFMVMIVFMIIRYCALGTACFGDGSRSMTVPALNLKIECSNGCHFSSLHSSIGNFKVVGNLGKSLLETTPHMSEKLVRPIACI
jgi:hypothetical protein